MSLLALAVTFLGVVLVLAWLSLVQIVVSHPALLQLKRASVRFARRLLYCLFGMHLLSSIHDVLIELQGFDEIRLLVDSSDLHGLAGEQSRLEGSCSEMVCLCVPVSWRAVHKVVLHVVFLKNNN